MGKAYVTPGIRKHDRPLILKLRDIRDLFEEKFVCHAVCRRGDSIIPLMNMASIKKAHKWYWFNEKIWRPTLIHGFSIVFNEDQKEAFDEITTESYMRHSMSSNLPSVLLNLEEMRNSI